MAINELTNDLFIFGGYGNDFNGNWGYLNDLWRYNLNSNTWFWLGGSSSVPHGPSTAHQPCGRSSAAMFAGQDGLQFDLSIFGGVGSPAGGAAGALADVWSINTEAPVGFTSAAPASSRTVKTSTASTTHTTEEGATTKTTKAPLTIGGTTSTKNPHATTKATTTKAAAVSPTTEEPRPTPPATPHTVEGPTEEPATKASTSAPATRPPLFDATSPQKIAALVMGSFIAIVLLVGGIIFLGFAMTSAAPAGSRIVSEPYLAV